MSNRENENGPGLHGRGLTRRQFLGAGGGVAGAVILGAAIPGGRRAAQVTHAGATLLAARVASSLAIGTSVATEAINPLNDQYATYEHAAFDALTSLAPGKPAAPALATSWTRTGGTTWTFKLRQGVMFHDGTTMTASDVAFSFNTIVEQKYGNFPTLLTIKSVTASDPATVVIETVAPDPLLLDRVAQVYIVPQAYWTKVGVTGFGAKPIGTGPYQITANTPNVSITFDAFPGYWGPKARTGHIVLTSYQDPSSLQSAFQAGQLDIAHYLSSDALTTITEPGLVVSSATASQTNMIQINTTTGPFADARVRRAANMAVDVTGLIKALENGHATPENGQLGSPLEVGYDPSLKRPAYDPAGAKRLLAQAGYPHGFSTTLTGLVTSQTDLEGVAGQLRNVGIKAAVNAEQISAWLPQFLNGTSTPLFQRGIAWSGIYDVSRAYQYIQLAPPSVTMVKDAKWEALYAKQATELNPTARLAALQACARYVNEENYILWTYGASTVGAWKKGVTGVNLDTGVMLELADIAKAV